MAQNLSELEKLLKELTDRSSAIKVQLEFAQIDLEFFSSIRNKLQENIAFLKKEGIITMLSEYKKSQTDLRLADSKVSAAQITKDNLQEMFKKTEASIAETKESIDFLRERDYGKVIEVDFRHENKEDGQE